MSSRTQAADHYDEIAKRLTEIQAERMQSIAGCVCPVDMLDRKQHTHNCPLAPQLSVTLIKRKNDQGEVGVHKRGDCKGDY